MIIGITGTPGTGKTSASALLDDVLDLNGLIKSERLYLGIDRERNSLIADLDVVYERILEIAHDQDGSDLVIEGHLSHHLSDAAIVLRLSPEKLEARLTARGYPEAKVMENLEAEMIDVILVEAVEWCSKVYEIDTTDRTVEEVAYAIREVISAIDCGVAIDKYTPGSIDWSEHLYDD